MTSGPLVSVCIPVYNGEKHVGETIKSVLQQTYPNVEVIIQDNASTDGTWSILQDMAQQDARISIERNAANYGMAGNWNIAINRARGDYVMLLSADDLLEPTFVTTCLQKIAEESIEAVVTNHFFLREGEITKRKKLVQPGGYQGHCGVILLYNPFSINFTLFRKSLIDRLRVHGAVFRSSFTCDYDLSLRVAFSGAKIQYLEDCLGVYRVHEANLSRQAQKMLRQTVLVVLAHKERLRKSCPLAYRFTLLRFIARTYSHAAIGRFYDRRLLSVLWRALLGG